MQHPDARTVLAKLWTSKGINLPSQVLENVTLKLPSGLDEDGPELKVGEQSLKSSFRIGVASQVTVTAVTLASAFLYELRLEVQKKRSEKRNDGKEVKSEEVIEREVRQLIEKCSKRIPIITVSARHSALEFASEKYTRVYREDSRSTSTTSTAPSSSEDSTSSTSDQQSNSIHFLDPRAKQILRIPEDAVGDWDPLAGIYETKPQGNKRQFVRLHSNFPHHKRGLLGILGLLPSTSRETRFDSSYASSTKRERSITREMVQKVLRSWDALEFETVAREKGLCATMMRSEKEWEESEMGKSVRKAVEEWEGPLSVERIEESGSSSFIKDQGSSSATTEPVQNESNNSCLGSGFGDVGNGDAGRALRIVDLSRVIAAPVAARTLAAHGASVLLLSSPLNPHLPNLELDTARGKRAAHLDLDEVKADPNTYDPDTHAPKIESYPGREQFKDLVKNGDVVLQAYRPSGLASRGLSPEALQEVRPGIVFASLSAYGPTGPWSEARGFDSLTQTACGMNHSESLSFEAFKREVDVEDLEVDLQVEPRALPVQALDHSAGYLLAFGILTAKIHQSLLELKDLISTEANSISPSSRVGFTVTLSLATTATWLKDLGRISGKEAWETPQSVEPQSEEVRSLLEPTRIRGEDEIVLFGMQHSGMIEGRRVGWKESPKGLGGDEVKWV